MHALLPFPSLIPTPQRRHRGARYWLAGCGLLVCLSLAPAQTQAQAPAAVSDRDQQARQLFEQGRTAYGDGRYRDAWANFHEAYQLSGRPELLFNIGQTADRLGQEADAIKAFSMYLERLPNAPNRRDVENRVRALRERIAVTQQASAPAPAAAARAAAPPQPQAPAPATPAAKAEPVTSPKPATAPRQKEPRRGFYLRAAIGAGYRGDAISRTIDDGAFSETFDLGIDGYGLALDLGFGWGVLPGFAIGGGLFLDFASAPSVSEDLGDGSTYEWTLSSANLATIGPFIDWYPVRKTLGWHILGGFGAGILRYHDKSNSEDFNGSAYGISILVGTGYEFNLGTTTALGVEVRFTGAALTEDVAAETTSHGFLSPSLLMSFTWF